MYLVEGINYGQGTNGILFHYNGKELAILNDFFYSITLFYELEQRGRNFKKYFLLIDEFIHRKEFVKETKTLLYYILTSNFILKHEIFFSFKRLEIFVFQRCFNL